MGPAGELKWVILIGGFAGVALAIWSTLREREPAGPVIFDACASFWLRLVGIVCVGRIITTGLFPPANLFGWAVPADMFGWAVRALLIAFVLVLTGGRTQICQHGVRFMSVFVPWKRIREIQWPSDNAVRFVRDGWLTPSIKMRIPTTARDRVQAFLEDLR